MTVLARRMLSEGLGTGLLVATVVGSGISAVRLAPDEPALQLLVNSLVTGGVLVALILTLHHVSAHLNPVVTLIEVARGQVSGSTAGGLVVAQVVGAVGGSILANLMFDLSAVDLAQQERTGGALLLAEVVATFGLCLVIVGAGRNGDARSVAVAVGGYIAAAYWFTSSTSFANPAVTVGRMFTDSFSGIAPSSVPLFVLAQLVGGGLALLVARSLFVESTVKEPA